MGLGLLDNKLSGLTSQHENDGLDMNFFTSIFVSFLLTGCIGMIHIDTDGYFNKNSGQMKKDSTIWLVQNDKADNPILEEEIRIKVVKLLISKGYKLTDLDHADYILAYGYGIGSAGQAVSSWTDNRGRTFVDSDDQFVRWFNVRVLDAQAARTGAKVVVWEGRTRSSGTSSNFRKLVNYLILATLDKMGQDTSGQPRRTIMTYPDQRAEELNR